jgi:hypothetical protein
MPDELVQSLIRTVADVIVIARKQRDAKIARFHPPPIAG